MKLAVNSHLSKQNCQVASQLIVSSQLFYRSYECQSLASVSLIKRLYYKHWYDVWPYNKE